MLSICVKLNIIMDICSHDNYQRGNKKGIWELCGESTYRSSKPAAYCSVLNRFINISGPIAGGILLTVFKYPPTIQVQGA